MLNFSNTGTLIDKFGAHYPPLSESVTSASSESDRIQPCDDSDYRQTQASHDYFDCRNWYGVIFGREFQGRWFGLTGARSSQEGEAQLQLGMGFRIVALVLAAAVLLFGMPAVDAARSLQSFDVPALFVLGDSLADVGTNNYLPQNTSRADFPPYGKTFFGRPTGRFSDGRLAVDFLAEALGLPFVPPFLQPNTSFTKGVNFASAGSGLLDPTGGGLVVPISVQLQQFGTAKSILQQQLGVETANTLISKSIFFIVSGTNDINGYLSNATLQREINATDYLASAISNYQETLLALYNGGARKVVVLTLGPIGCIPSARASNPTHLGECLVVANQLALAFNAALRQVVDGLRSAYPDFNIVIGFTFDTVSAIISDGASFGLTNVTSACCGAGFLNAQVQCGKPLPPGLPNAVADFCERPAKSLFWDLAHPTEVTVDIIFNLIYSGNASNAYPINVKALAEL